MLGLFGRFAGIMGFLWSLVKLVFKTGSMHLGFYSLVGWIDRWGFMARVVGVGVDGVV